jgi:hypothetical protein
MTKRTTATRPPVTWSGARQPTTALGVALQWGVGLAVWGGFVALVLAYVGAI